MKEACLIYEDTLLDYKFNDEHPFNPKRLALTMELLESMNAVQPSMIKSLDQFGEDSLYLTHEKEYIDVVKKASRGELDKDLYESVGLGTEDTPIFHNMHDSAFDVVRASLSAARAVASGETKHALNLSGGLHHGLKSKGAGFCIYNDVACAINYLKKEKGWKVLYIDTDAHHGDGVQWAFYDDPDVMTFSIHETGRYLFPGTGDITERGIDRGYGYCYNLPVQAFTEDKSWLHVFRTAVEKIADFFKPDIIVSQHGVDGHLYDPLTHLCLSMESYINMPKLIHEMAHEHCEGRWLALGGGGYDIWRVVPRAWSLLWLEMSGQTDLCIADQLPSKFVNKYAGQVDEPFPATWNDDRSAWPDIPRRETIDLENDVMLRQALKPLFHFI